MVRIAHKMMQTGWRVSAVLVALVVLLAARPAHAGFELCNHASHVLRAALATPEEGGWHVRGWEQVRPGECREVSRQVPEGDSFYVYAESHMAHEGEVHRWAGNRLFCVHPDDFDMHGPEACPEGEGNTRPFVRVAIEPGVTEWSHRFREPSSRMASLRSARNKGLQRLLNETGFFSGSFDGYLGRRTRAAINRAKADLGVTAAGFDSDALVDALIARRVADQNTRGLKVCNETPYEVWSAVAYGPENDWMSRGWWALAPNACAPVIKDELPDRFLYVYGEAQSADGSRIVWGGDHPFCIADVKFEIDGSERCVERGFQPKGFQRIDTGEEAVWTLRFRDEDATILPPDGG